MGIPGFHPHELRHTAASLAIASGADIKVVQQMIGPQIGHDDDFGDAICWAVTTMTTVGYGDRYPVTGIGRMVAFALMLGGIALLGTVTATLASWLVENVEAEKEQAEDLQATVRRLEAKIELLATDRTPIG